MRNGISNKFGIVGFVISLIAVLFFWVPYLGLILLLIGLGLCIFQIIKDYTIFAVAGLVISIVLLIPAIIITYNSTQTTNLFLDQNIAINENLKSDFTSNQIKSNYSVIDNNFLQTSKINSSIKTDVEDNLDIKKDLINEYMVSVFGSNINILNVVEYNAKNKLINFEVIDKNLYFGLDLKNYSDNNLNLKDATLYNYDDNSLNKIKSKKYYLAFIYDPYYPKCYGDLKYSSGGFLCKNNLLTYPVEFTSAKWLDNIDDLELDFGCEERLLYQKLDTKLFYCSYRPSYFYPEFINGLEYDTYDTDFVSIILKSNSTLKQVFISDKNKLLNYTCNILNGKVVDGQCNFLDFNINFDNLINIFYRSYPKVVSINDFKDPRKYEILDELLCFSCGNISILFMADKVGYYKENIYNSYSYIPKKIGQKYYKYIFDDNYNLKIYNFGNKNYSYYNYNSKCEQFGGEQGNDLKYGQTCDFYGDLDVDFLLIVKLNELYLDNDALSMIERSYLRYLEDYKNYNDFVFVTKQLNTENYRFNDYGDSYYFIRLNENDYYEIYIVFENSDKELYIKEYQLLR